jgi:hypothetical protein
MRKIKKDNTKGRGELKRKGKTRMLQGQRMGIDISSGANSA